MAILSKLLSSAVLLAGARAHALSKMSKPSVNLAQISKYANINGIIGKDEFFEINTEWSSDTIAKTAIDYSN
jgi:hypothetical protein